MAQIPHTTTVIAEVTIQIPITEKVEEVKTDEGNRLRLKMRADMTPIETFVEGLKELCDKCGQKIKISSTTTYKGDDEKADQ